MLENTKKKKKSEGQISVKRGKKVKSLKGGCV